ncbi:MAG: carboxypeptidase-like regulatory domain-containing protein [Chloroflexota bacterium]
MFIGTTLWYKFVAPATERVVARTNFSDFDTAIAAFEGDATDPLTCNDDYNAGQSTIVFNVTQGMTYFIQAGGHRSNVGSLHLQIDAETEFASIEGTVTDHDTQTPLGGICVELFDANQPGNFNRIAKATTPSDGTYSLFGLDAGNYTLFFNDCDDGLYASVYYHGAKTQATSQKLILGAGVTMTGIDQDLLVGGTITGQVPTRPRASQSAQSVSTPASSERTSTSSRRATPAATTRCPVWTTRSSSATKNVTSQQRTSRSTFPVCEAPTTLLRRRSTRVRTSPSTWNFQLAASSKA